MPPTAAKTSTVAAIKTNMVFLRMTGFSRTIPEPKRPADYSETENYQQERSCFWVQRSQAILRRLLLFCGE